MNGVPHPIASGMCKQGKTVRALRWPRPRRAFYFAGPLKKSEAIRKTRNQAVGCGQAQRRPTNFRTFCGGSARCLTAPYHFSDSLLLHRHPTVHAESKLARRQGRAGITGRGSVGIAARRGIGIAAGRGIGAWRAAIRDGPGGNGVRRRRQVRRPAGCAGSTGGAQAGAHPQAGWQ